MAARRPITRISGFATQLPAADTLDLNGSRLINVGTPTLDPDGATKLYADLSAGMRRPVRVRYQGGTDATPAGNAPNSVDGILLALNDRVLFAPAGGQLEYAGIYVVTVIGSGSNGTWVRADDANAYSPYGAKSSNGMIVRVQEGTLYTGTFWICTGGIYQQWVSSLVSSTADGFMLRTDKTKIDGVASGADVTLTKLAAASAAVTFNGQRLATIGTPTATTDATRKDYVDAADFALHQFVGMKVPARVRFIAPYQFQFTGGAPNTADGIGLAVNDRILVEGYDYWDQSGVYRVTVVGTGSNGTWVRDPDVANTGGANSGIPCPTFCLCYVREGTTWGGTWFYAKNGGYSNMWAPWTASATNDGPLTKADKSKLDGIAAGADATLIKLAAASAPVAINNQRLVSVAPPVDPTDAATRLYVDNSVWSLTAPERRGIRSYYSKDYAGAQLQSGCAYFVYIGRLTRAGFYFEVPQLEVVANGGSNYPSAAEIGYATSPLAPDQTNDIQTLTAVAITNSYGSVAAPYPFSVSSWTGIPVAAGACVWMCFRMVMATMPVFVTLRKYEAGFGANCQMIPGSAPLAVGSTYKAAADYSWYSLAVPALTGRLAPQQGAAYYG